MPLSRKIKWFFYKFIGMLSIVRGYNLMAIVLAQYLTSIFILSENQTAFEVIGELKLFTLILASVLAIASGYIINSFYDIEKDLINRPQKSHLDRLVSQRTKMSTYFVLNFLSIIVASYNSFNAVLFFSFYIFGIWLYSHKLKRISIIGNLVATLLAIFPFFAIFIYYKNYDWVIFGHAHFLTILILMREIIKDLENISGDIALGYQTIPIKYGEKTAKIIVQLLIIITFIITVVFINCFSQGRMNYYFIFCDVTLLIFSYLLFMADSKKKYLKLHNILKFLIVLGVFSIMFINPNNFSRILF